MINYDEINNYFTGLCAPVIMNAGGVFLELGEDISSLFYKLDENHYADVNHPGIVAQKLGTDSVITSRFVIFEDTIKPVTSKNTIHENTTLVRRLFFNPEKYKMSK